MITTEDNNHLFFNISLAGVTIIYVMLSKLS